MTLRRRGRVNAEGVYVGVVEGRLFLSFLGYRPYQFASRAKFLLS